MSLSTGQLMPFPNRPGNYSVPNFPEVPMSHGISAEDMMGNGMPSIAFVSPDTMVGHQGDIPMAGISDLGPNMDLYSQTAQVEIPPPDSSNYSSHEADSRPRLKRPKRTMSAYSCYSHSVFKKVREQMGEQSKQSDIFRVIANQWKQMTPEQKKPFVDEAARDHGRYKKELQDYNKFRREVEKSFNQTGSFTGNVNYRNSLLLRKAFQERNTVQIAQLLLEANNRNVKETLDLVNQTIKVLSTSGQTLLTEQQMLQNGVATIEAESAESKSKKPYHCPHPGCNKAFTWKSNLTAHLHIHDPQRRKNYVCNYPDCGKAFYDMQHLRQHQWIHIRKPDAYVCHHPNCGKKYNTYGGLQLHIRGHHKNDKRYVCAYENCRKSFVRRSDLHLHTLRVHQQEKPFKCDVDGCGKTFVSNSELKRHKVTHMRYNAMSDLQLTPNPELPPIELCCV